MFFPLLIFEWWQSWIGTQWTEEKGWGNWMEFFFWSLCFVCFSFYLVVWCWLAGRLDRLSLLEHSILRMVFGAKLTRSLFFPPRIYITKKPHFHSLWNGNSNICLLYSSDALPVGQSQMPEVIGKYNSMNMHWDESPGKSQHHIGINSCAKNMLTLFIMWAFCMNLTGNKWNVGITRCVAAKSGSSNKQ